MTISISKSDLEELLKKWFSASILDGEVIALIPASFETIFIGNPPFKNLLVVSALRKWKLCSFNKLDKKSLGTKISNLSLLLLSLLLTSSLLILKVWLGTRLLHTYSKFYAYGRYPKSSKNNQLITDQSSRLKVTKPIESWQLWHQLTVIGSRYGDIDAKFLQNIFGGNETNEWNEWIGGRVTL